MPNEDGELTPIKSHLLGLEHELGSLEARIAAKRPADDPADLKARVAQVKEQMKIYFKGDPATTAAKRDGAQTAAVRTDAPGE